MAKLCAKCGRKVENGQKFCEVCKNKQNGKSEIKVKNNFFKNYKKYLWILGFILPPVGLVLYLMWKNTKKVRRKLALRTIFLIFVTCIKM